MSCVRPGVLPVRANFFWPVSLLMALDLPAFDLPANAISRPASLGHSESLLALWVKFARWKNRWSSSFGGINLSRLGRIMSL